MELIKREDALEAIKNAELGQEYDEVEKVPSVDAVPVVHGHWTESDKCSVCGFMADIDYEYDTLLHYKGEYAWNYCPNCGARMDGERREG